jgi:TonB-dependent SusC/RagA subfamily outer membrane receptor
MLSMKNLLSLILLFTTALCFAQDYRPAWDKVMELENEGQIKSAAAEVEKIYALAKKDKNEPQLLKSFFFRSKYLQTLDEQAQVKIIKNIKEEIAVATIPTRAIMESIYAEIMEGIYNHNRYLISRRTTVEGKAPDDILLWTTKNFEDEIDAAYKRSLANREVLYKTPLSNYQAIVDFNPETVTIPRSLYDLLAERYIFSYKNTVSYNDAMHSVLFGTAEEFSKLKFISDLEERIKDRLLLCRELESYYSSKNDRYSLQRTILRRLNYADEIVYGRGEQAAYLQTVLTLAEEWKTGPFAYMAKLKAAKLYAETADKKQSPENFIKAVALCNDIITHAEGKSVAGAAMNLKESITHQRLYITAEKTVIPNRPVLMQVTFRNTDSVSVSIYKVSSKQILYANVQYKLQDIVSKSTLYKSIQYKLPVVTNHFEYTTEIALPALPEGFYIISVSPVKPQEKESSEALVVIQASSIAVVEQQVNDKMRYQVVNRATGAPVKNARATIGGRKYSSNKKGFIVVDYVQAEKKRHNFIYKNDTLQSGYNNYYSQNNKNIEATAQIYLDRAIYRPGQKVFYKGIVVLNKEGIVITVPNVYVTVTVEDANDDEIAKFRLKANEFGSVAGEFTLPKAVTGSYKIYIDEDEEYEDSFYDMDGLKFEEGYSYFRVEEYKRPTFEVTFNEVKNDIKLGQKAVVTGVAKTFSGVPVQNATVKYRITRNGHISRIYYTQKWSNDEIATGTVLTDAEGKFSIEFEALPDLALDAKGLPIFTFEVNADVTDVTGETRTGYTSVYGGYHSLQLNVVVPFEVNPSDADNKLHLISTNLNGEEKPAEGKVEIYTLVQQEKNLKRRPWQAPELPSIPEEEFKKLFPLFPYKDAENEGERIKKVWSAEVNTGKETKVSMPDMKGWDLGQYEVLFTAKDSSGHDIEAVRQFTVKRKTEIKFDPNNPVELKIINKDYAKDGLIAIKLRSPLPLLYINVMAANNGKIFYDSQVKYKGNEAIINIPLSKNIIESIALNIDYVWENELYSERRNVKVEEEANLKITTESITNKLLPGSSQTWSFIIDGQLPAEVLAGMYDASLDKFTTEHWADLAPDNNYQYTFLPHKSMLNGTGYGQFSSYRQRYDGQPVEDKFYTFGYNVGHPTTLLRAFKPKNQLPKSGDYLITGIVLGSDHMPIPGVSVMVQSTSDGVQTDFDGRYAIYASKGDRLVYSYIGMKTQTVTVAGPAEVDIVFEDDVMLEEVVVEGYQTTSRRKSNVAVTTITSETIEGRPNVDFIQSLQGQIAGLEISTASGQPGASNTTVILRGVGSINGSIQPPLYIIDGVPLSEKAFRELNANDISEVSILKNAEATALYGNRGANGAVIITTKQGTKEIEALQQVQARKNFNETAFFYPQLRTDDKGRIKFTFTTPEALTQWKLRLFAHNKKAESGYIENTVVTQKDFMVVPNMPRFLREQDTVIIVAKITNLTAEIKEGNAMLQLFDPATMQPIDADMLNVQAVKPFTMGAKENTTVSWKIVVPMGLQGVQYKIVAKAGDFTDGEENILPVLSNRMLVTESLPLWVKPNTTRQYTLENLKNNTSHTLKHHGITLEYTSNPAWVALQSLPYLMEYEHECAEQVFSRYYANAIGSHIINSNPKIAEVFDAWRKEGRPASKLEQNEELKSIILAETPWLLDTQSEEEKKNRLALLFNMDQMKASLKSNLTKLAKKQAASGGFPWFEGGKEDAFITRYIVAGLGHLNRVGIKPIDEGDIKGIIKDAVGYIDNAFLQSHKVGMRNNEKWLIGNHYTSLHYLYARSFHISQFPLKDSLQKVTSRYVQALKGNWLKLSLYEKGLAALVLHRFGETAAAKKVLVNLKETSANNEEHGMYWIENNAGWWWYRAPIETQALLIEGFTEIDNDTASADAMKVWLIKNKQNKNWPTTKSTAEAVYALLMQGSNWLSVQENTTIKLGTTNTVEAKMAEASKEAGTGYVKLTWQGSEVTKDMATLIVENKSEVPGYGGFYWQYFEDLDRIKPAQEGIMNILKELYLKKNAPDGPQLQPIKNDTALTVGDLVTIRLVLEIKEDVEYVHLKDLRAAAFEPVDVLSRYEWKDGLGFYRTTRDAATHFFFDRISKGTYVLEYDVRVNNAGEYSNGITSIQSMYAPEFSGHTKGIRVKTQ